MVSGVNNNASRWLGIVQVLGPAALAALALRGAALQAPGSAWFYLLTVLAAAIYFVAFTLFGRRTAAQLRFRLSHLVRGALIGAVLLAVFILGALVVRSIPLLAAPVHQLLDNARTGTLWLTVIVTFINGIGEEVFFRGTAPALLSVSARWKVPAAVVLYAMVTAALGVPLLVFAALVIGAVAHFEVKRTGGLTSAMAMHTVWAQGMLLVLPLLV